MRATSFSRWLNRTITSLSTIYANPSGITICIRQFSNRIRNAPCLSQDVQESQTEEVDSSKSNSTRSGIVIPVFNISCPGDADYDEDSIPVGECPKIPLFNLVTLTYKKVLLVKAIKNMLTIFGESKLEK